MQTIRVWTNFRSEGEPPEVEAMDLEEYLRGVVPHEMSPAEPLEALKAQAVAARTFALAAIPPAGRSRHGNIADVSTTDHCQVWSAETFHATDTAIGATAGQYLRHGNQIATAFFFGRCGGRTKAPIEAGWPGSAPWCQPVDCLTVAPPVASGHGVGMCQDGTVLMAQRGYDYATILNHYYTNVTLALIGLDVPPATLGYDSQYILMSQTAGPDVWSALGPYVLRFRVTSGFSHDDALRVHGDRHTITIPGDVGQPWSVSLDLERFLRKVAPSNVTVERVEAATLADLADRLAECIAQGNPFAYR